MITSSILNIVYAFVFLITSPMRVFDDVVISENIVNAFATAGGYVNALGVFLPVSTLLAILAIVISIESGIFTYKGIMWIIKRVPTQS